MALHSLDEMADRGFAQLPQAGGLQRSPNAGLNVVNALLAITADAGRLEGYPLELDRDPPSLLAQVGDQETNGPEFHTVAVINVAPGQRPKFVGKTGRQPWTEI
jgi:hypothetical protein